MTMQTWFPAAKLGIFIHYGMYAVDGVAESWSFYNGTVPHEQYMRQLNGFTADNYHPRAWADLFARAGACYAVLTARHHDGFALWDTEYGDLNIRHTPAGRDLIGPYADALRERGLKVGLYYSHSDWNHPDYATVRSTGRAPDVNTNSYTAPAQGQDNPAAWARFLQYRDGQIDELMQRYKPDLMWFDGEWERSEQQWDIDTLADRILAANPSTILNGRMGTRGDYHTPEQAPPIQQPDRPWELCLTINDSWGYRPTDTNHKSVGKLVRYFTETIGAGGNLLLDVGPKADGTITAEQTNRLEHLGTWIARHEEAVYGTIAGLPPGHHYGPSTLSADRRTIYLVCFDQPREAIGVRGLRTPIKRARVLGTETELNHSVTGGLGDVPGVQWIDAPGIDDLNPHATVIALELDGELDLYQGTGRS